MFYSFVEWVAINFLFITFFWNLIYDQKKEKKKKEKIASVIKPYTETTGLR